MNRILRESSIEIYHSIIDYNPDAIFVLSIHGEIMEVNQVVTKIFGYSEEEIQGIHYRNLIVHEQVEEVHHHSTKVLQGIPYEGESDFFHKNGEILHIQVKCIPLTVKNEMVGVFSVTKDLTELHRAKTSLKESEERYRKVVEFSPKGIMVHRKGTILYANPSALKTLKETSLVNKPIFSYIHTDYHKSYKRRVSMAELGNELPFIKMKMV